MLTYLIKPKTLMIANGSKNSWKLKIGTKLEDWFLKLKKVFFLGKDVRTTNIWCEMMP